MVEELRLHLDQTIAGVGIDPAGRVDVLRPPVDPRFQRPLSGLYWQITGDGVERHSRSLWDEVLDLPPIDPAAPRAFSLKGPANADLLVVAREVITETKGGDRPIVAAIGIDRSDISNATSAFRRDLAPFLALLAVVLMAASLAQILIGLRPLRDLRERIAQIRSGKAQRLGSTFPDEVRPLTMEVDALLSSREEQLRRAREKASELAHAFKTPLQALSGDVRRLRNSGQTEAAGEIETLIGVMRRLVDHEMARARMAEGHANLSDIKRVVANVVSVVSRTPAGMTIDWSIDVPEGLSARIDPDDLSEVLGNLVENAVRYGRTTVSVIAATQNEFILLEIGDDGPGIPEEKLAQVLRRGERLDTSSGGAGLGLAITESIVQMVGGEIELRNGVQGLRVSVRLPLGAAS